MPSKITIINSFMLFKVIYRTEIHVLNSTQKLTYEELLKFVRTAFSRVPSSFTLTYIDSDEDVISIHNDSDLKILQESGISRVKIIITEDENRFFDQTQQLKIQPEVKDVSSRLSALKLEEMDLSKIEDGNNLDDSISFKLNELMPEIISKVKDEVLKESKVKEQVDQSVSLSKLELVKPTKPIHKHIVCDNCEMDPIVGIRYKCAICPNYDLCEDCEARTTHDHPFLKIRNRQQAPHKIIAIVNDDKNSFQVNGDKMDFKKGLECVKDFMNVFEGVKKEIKEQVKREQKIMETELSAEDIKIINGDYLSEILGISINDGYKYAKTHISLTKEELLEKYINEQLR